MIELKNIVKKYGKDVTALKGIRVELLLFCMKGAVSMV